jgi:AcrR family transcriptional regulator
VPNTATRRPGRPPSANAADTRERILRAAREIFGELGYDAATFQAIAVRADLTRPAINHYFAGKRILYNELVEGTTELLIAAGVTKAGKETTLLGRLSAFFSAATQDGSRDRSAAAFLVTSVLESRRHPELADDERNPLAASRAYITWALEDAIERGELGSDTDVPTLGELLIAVMWGMGFYADYVGRHDQLNASRNA